MAKLSNKSIEGGNDGVVVTGNGVKYVSSVRFGSVTRINSRVMLRLLLEEYRAPPLCVMTQHKTN